MGGAIAARPVWREPPVLVAVALVLSYLLQVFVGRVYLIPLGVDGTGTANVAQSR
ncbi:hypothetical protein GCM10023094_34920 [Rhodococcus olei]|uniref:Uncharacterized protein n=1 Tax=Rhodococcus olei TaxID=2161675 RepID=A0ABP8PBC8_9NOCA